MERLAKGTIENLYIDVKDRLNNLTTLDGLTLTWEVKGDEDESIANGPASNDDMLVICGPLNTTTWEQDEYDLYVIIANPPETIRLGPFRFVVD